MSTSTEKYLVLVTRSRIITEEALITVESEKKLTLLELRDKAEEHAESLSAEAWEETDINMDYDEFASQPGSSDIIKDDNEDNEDND
jgi:hypothetical protein